MSNSQVDSFFALLGEQLESGEIKEEDFRYDILGAIYVANGATDAEASRRVRNVRLQEASSVFDECKKKNRIATEELRIATEKHRISTEELRVATEELRIATEELRIATEKKDIAIKNVNENV